MLDLAGVFPRRCNDELVEVQRIHDPNEIAALRTLIQWHVKKTRSWRASQILSEWTRMQRVFWRVLPRDNGSYTETSTTTACDYVNAHAYYGEMQYT